MLSPYYIHVKCCNIKNLIYCAVQTILSCKKYFVEIFLLDDVDCDGTETSLAQCNHSPPGVENCGTAEHLYVTCGK